MAKKKKIVMGVLIALVVAGGGFTAYSTISGVKNSMASLGGKYSVIEAGENDLSKTISNSGKVIGNGTVDVTTKLTAEVSEVNVSIGDSVKEGDVLCVFDDSEIREKYNSLKKRIKNSNKKTENSHEKNERDLETAKSKKKIAVARAKRAYDKAVRERDNAYNKYNSLVNEYNSHLNDGEDTGYDFASADAAIDQLYEGLSAYDDAVTTAQDAYNDTIDQWDETIQEYQDVIDAEEFTEDNEDNKELKELKEQLDQCTVTAPQDGVITALNVNEGTIPQSASLMTIVNTDKTVIELTVKETEITHISEGMEAVVTSKVLPDEKMPAKITRIVNVLSSDPAAMTEGGEGGSGYKVEVTLDTTNEELLIGMSASVEITLEAVGKKLSVPYSGIVEEDDKTYVYVATPDKENKGSYTAKKVEITTGVESDFYTEIAGGDVKKGDLIIENPQGDDLLEPVTDGGRIMVNE